MGRFHRHDDGTTHTHDHDGHHDHHHDDLARAGIDPATSAHGDLSAYETGAERVTVLERIFDENDRAAETNRDRFDAAGVRCINLMSAPGAGKTTLLTHTLAFCADKGIRAGVIEGDIETSLDADRLVGVAAQVALLNTGQGFGGECHLDAPMVARALEDLDLDALDLVVVENVGNLVCPAEFDVGAHARVMVCSVTEGEDKPLKYPVMYRAVDVILINKIDLVPHLDLDLDLLRANIAAVNPTAEVIEVSARTGEGLDRWHEWLLAAAGSR